MTKIQVGICALLFALSCNTATESQSTPNQEKPKEAKASPSETPKEKASLPGEHPLVFP